MASCKVLTKEIFVQLLTDLEPDVLKARFRVSSKLIKDAKKLQGKKVQTEKMKEKNGRKAERCIEQVKFLREMRKMDILKFVIMYTKPEENLSKDPNVSSEERALAHISRYQSLRDKISTFRTVYPSWEEYVPDFIKSLGMNYRYRQKRLAKYKEKGKLSELVEREKKLFQLLSKYTKFSVNPQWIKDSNTAPLKFSVKKKTKKGNNGASEILENVVDEEGDSKTSHKPINKNDGANETKSKKCRKSTLSHGTDINFCKKSNGDPSIEDISELRGIRQSSEKRERVNKSVSSKSDFSSLGGIDFEALNTVDGDDLKENVLSVNGATNNITEEREEDKRNELLSKKKRKLELSSYKDQSSLQMGGNKKTKNSVQNQRDKKVKSKTVEVKQVNLLHLLRNDEKSIPKFERKSAGSDSDEENYPAIIPEDELGDRQHKRRKVDQARSFASMLDEMNSPTANKSVNSSYCSVNREIDKKHRKRSQIKNDRIQRRGKKNVYSSADRGANGKFKARDKEWEDLKNYDSGNKRRIKRQRSQVRQGRTFGKDDRRFSSSNETPIGARKLPKYSGGESLLHPSWAAKKQMNNASLTSFQGKKTTFDD